MFLRAFDVETTRRLSIGLMASAGALLFAALNLIGVGISAEEPLFTAGITKSLWPLSGAAGSGLISLIYAEIAALPYTPEEGHPHSKQNYLQSAFAMISVMGLFCLVYGTIRLVSAASVY